MAFRLSLALAALALLGAAPDPVRVDPLTVQDDDFARHRDPATWRGLTVTRVEFVEERARWRLWRIASSRPGPLWFVPHDDENAGFEAALVAVRRHGGTVLAVDSGIVPGRDGQRRNAAVAFGPAIDPNRHFHDGLPRYAGVVVAERAPGQPIIALHSNGAGYDPTESLCPPEGDTSGRGIISIRYCDDVLTPSASKSRAWPFDDDDSLAFATYAAHRGRGGAFCGPELVAADFNVVFERVANTDGSLSNYAVLRGLPYLNFETRDRGTAGLPEARDRLVAMIDRGLEICPRPKG